MLRAPSAGTTKQETGEPLGTPGLYGHTWTSEATQSKQRAQHAGKHIPCAPVFTVSSGGGGVAVKYAHPEGQPLSPPPGVLLNSPSSFLAHALQRWGLGPKKRALGL